MVFLTHDWQSSLINQKTRYRNYAQSRSSSSIQENRTCAAEFSANTPYMYSCYEGDGLNLAECEADPTDKNKVIILGGGPNRIGQGIEFDYCCVHAAYALSEVGFETIMVNCNPETVSTDYDTSDRLYFEPLTAESVISLIKTEEKLGKVVGVIVQLGGQTPLKLSKALKEAGINILGTSPRQLILQKIANNLKSCSMIKPQATSKWNR